MHKTTLNYRTALLMALGISLLMNLVLVLMFFYGRDAVLPPDGGAHKPMFEPVNLLAHLFFNFLLAFLLYLINFRMARNPHVDGGWKRGLYLAVGTLLCTVALSYLFSLIQIQLIDFGPHPQKFIRGGIMRDSFIAVVVILSSQLLYLTEKQQLTVIENEALMAENIRARFAALKNQMDPHFLFNSLNTLNLLIKTDPARAQEYVQQLSHVLRSALKNQEVITLEEELASTEAYCHLMQIRYGDNLRFAWAVEDRYLPYSIVPLCLQTLVENAVKHNVISNTQPMTITIATREGNIEVSNPVHPKREVAPGGGIGLDNLAERYRLLWKKEIGIVRDGEEFKVTIPLVK